MRNFCSTESLERALSEYEFEFARNLEEFRIILRIREEFLCLFTQTIRGHHSGYSAGCPRDVPGR